MQHCYLDSKNASGFELPVRNKRLCVDCAAHRPPMANYVDRKRLERHTPEQFVTSLEKEHLQAISDEVKLPTEDLLSSLQMTRDSDDSDFEPDADEIIEIAAEVGPTAASEMIKQPKPAEGDFPSDVFHRAQVGKATFANHNSNSFQMEWA